MTSRGPYERRAARAPRYPMHTLHEARYSYALAYRDHDDGRLTDSRKLWRR